MTEAMPFLQKVILLSYDPRPLKQRGFQYVKAGNHPRFSFAHSSCCHMQNKL